MARSFIDQIALPRVTEKKHRRASEDMSLVKPVAKHLWPILPDAGVRVQLVLENFFHKELQGRQEHTVQRKWPISMDRGK